MTAFDMIAFDADDTLWHNESFYHEAIERFEALLAPYHSAGQAERKLRQIELDNLGYYGYGIKGFALSLVEAAIEISGGHIRGAELRQVIDIAKGMLSARVRLLEHAEETVASLAGSYPLMLITKGDLFEQEAKVARSGLKAYFTHVQIVSDKTRDSYAAILARHHVRPDRFLMVGNSLRSDILPVVALGGTAVYVPNALTWAHENVPVPDQDRGKYIELEHLGMVPALIEELDARGSRRKT
ncbi:MAG: HAD family hydrolase [Thermoflexales bacterium]|nr:HAD family hydrolase [Thermoflexales bacterium]